MKKNSVVAVLTWRSDGSSHSQSKEFTTSSRIHDILLFAKNLQERDAGKIKLTLHLNQLCSSGRRVSLEDEMVTRLYSVLRSHGIEESTIHFI